MEEGWCCCSGHEFHEHVFRSRSNLRKGHSVKFLVSTGQMSSETIGQNREWKFSRIEACIHRIYF